jgi:hypothetical protein
MPEHAPEVHAPLEPAEVAAAVGDIRAQLAQRTPPPSLEPLFEVRHDGAIVDAAGMVLRPPPER